MLALAASVALLLLGSLLLSGQGPQRPEDVSTGAPSAKKLNLKDLQPGKGKPVAPQGQEKPERDPLDFELPPMK